MMRGGPRQIHVGHEAREARQDAGPEHARTREEDRALPHEQEDHGGQEQDDRLVIAHPESADERRKDEEGSAFRPLLPEDQQEDHRRDEQVVQRKDLRDQRPSPEQRIDREQQGHQGGRPALTGEPPGRQVDDPHGGGPADDGDQVHAERRLVERQQAEEVTEKRHDRVAGGMRDAEREGDRHELGRVADDDVACRRENVEDARRAYAARRERQHEPVDPRNGGNAESGCLRRRGSTPGGSARSDAAPALRDSGHYGEGRAGRPPAGYLAPRAITGS